jgi:hypothetical protein
LSPEIRRFSAIIVTLDKRSIVSLFAMYLIFDIPCKEVSAAMPVTFIGVRLRGKLFQYPMSCERVLYLSVPASASQAPSLASPQQPEYLNNSKTTFLEHLRQVHSTCGFQQFFGLL